MSWLLNLLRAFSRDNLKHYSTSIKSYLALIFLSAIWGSSFLFIKLSIDTITPSLLTFYRLLIASIFLAFFCKKRKILKLLIDNKILFFGIAIFGNVLPFNLISFSEIYVDSVVASTLIGTMPLFTFIISFFLFKKQIFNLLSVSGLLIGFIGMIIFIGLSNIFKPSLSSHFSLLIIISALSYGFAANLVKKVKDLSSLEIASFSTFLATLFALPILFLDLRSFDSIYYDVIIKISFKSWFAATILGLFCTGLAILIFFHLIKIRNAVFASQSNYLIPCFGTLWAYLFLDENLSENMFFGFFLIVVGGWMVNTALKKKGQ